MRKETSNPSCLSKAINKAALLVCAAICSALLLSLSGCASQPTAINPEEQTITASEYMVKLNQAAESLHENLNGFASAVTAGDITTLQSKCDAAFQSMDALNDLKVPDELVTVKNQYKDAVDALHASLNEYIAVFTEIQNEHDQSKIDLQKYAARFENIQKGYDNGMNLLEQADAAAKEL